MIKINKKIILVSILFLLILSGVVFAFQKSGQLEENKGDNSLLKNFSDGGFRSIDNNKNKEQEDLKNFNLQAILASETVDDNNSNKKQKFGFTYSLNFFAKFGNDLFGIEREIIFRPVNKIMEFKESIKVPKIIKVPEDYKLIQEAIDNAEDGDTVKVSAGEYRENIVMKEGVNLIGSNELVILENEELEKEIEKEIEEEKELSSETLEISSFSFLMERIIINETIINGGDSGNVISFKNGITDKTRLANFTIKNAGKNLSGILIEDSAPLIENNIITNNEYNIYIKGNSSPAIQKNSLRFGGRGIQIYNFEELESFTRGNKVDGDKIEPQATLANVASNSVFSPIIIDNLITDNKIGIDLYQSSALIDHNTISYNNHYKTYLGATYGINLYNSSAEISNNIITDSGICDLCAGVNVDEKSEDVILSYNNIWNNKNNFVCFGECVLEENNISEDPLFIDSANWNFMLQEESDLIGICEDGNDIGIRW